MTLPQIHSDDLTAYFDEETACVNVIYRGRMTAALTIRAYQWISELVGLVGAHNVQGGIFDFREVSDFRNFSLSAVMRESQKINSQVDLSHVPVALLAHREQELVLRMTLKVTPQDFRKRIVHSEEEAQAFIEAWHRRNVPDN